jgi:hypothetical protein
VGGTGLGLPISKSLIELQGGEMFVTFAGQCGVDLQHHRAAGPAGQTDCKRPMTWIEDAVASTKASAIRWISKTTRSIFRQWRNQG